VIVEDPNRISPRWFVLNNENLFVSTPEVFLTERRGIDARNRVPREDVLDLHTSN
jgi:hypothetical protein